MQVDETGISMPDNEERESLSSPRVMVYCAGIISGVSKYMYDKGHVGIMISRHWGVSR